MQNLTTLKITQNWMSLCRQEKLSGPHSQETEQNKIEVLRDLVATQNPCLSEHLSNVMDIVSIFCNFKSGFSQKTRHNLEIAALFHDVGKIGIPNAILIKQDALSISDWRIIKNHPLYSANILFGFEFSFDIVQAVLYHHERWDGRGYPFGLSGKSIPFFARVVSIIDVFDAITTDRPYRRAWSKQQAFEYILSGKGSQFDPRLVDQIIGLID